MKKTLMKSSLLGYACFCHNIKKLASFKTLQYSVHFYFYWDCAPAHSAILPAAIPSIVTI